MWIPDFDLRVVTVTAGQAEITALTTTSAETLSLSICSTLTDRFFSFTGSQSQQYLHRDPITKPATSFPLTATQNGLSQRDAGRREGGVRETQIETLGPLPGEYRDREGRNRA